MEPTGLLKPKAIITDFLSGLGQSDFWQIAAKYYQTIKGQPKRYVTKDLKIAGQVDDAYSFGKYPNNANDANWNDIPLIINQHIKAGKLPSDTNSYYVVLGDDTVVEGPADSGSCAAYCGYHTSVKSDQVSAAQYNYTTGIIPDQPDYVYTWVGNSDACGLNGYIGCGGDTVSPNGNRGVDAMLSPLAHELAEGSSNPNTYDGPGGSGWNNADGYENGDNCAYIYGSNRKFDWFGGFHYNQEWNGRKYQIQQLWDPETQLCGPSYKKAASDCAALAKVFPTLNFGDDCCNSGYADCTNGVVTAIDVRGNKLSGELLPLIDQIVYHFPWLNSLRLGSNHFTANQFPDRICELLFLQTLSLNSLPITNAQLPDCLFILFQLESFSMTSSGLVGEIPAFDFENFAPLKRLILSNNNLTGSIPTSLAKKDTLTYLFLNGNSNLSGPVPNGFNGFGGLSASPLANVPYCDLTGTKLCIPKGYTGPTCGAPAC
ncbi:RNI-like protein [Rhizoclosmatium globosum]|uniref:RNI-like protein n=1 Tax=Rhizoclosmatium globosum TaxID=329046 RepID=A0A1Y2CHD5_9FUNG|nr:RNI-like protein [Rhizoclosmatium globosum]|eukprot:ORY46422.1 RNI-like protein [Rhizoclosmatium globosum]